MILFPKDLDGRAAILLLQDGVFLLRKRYKLKLIGWIFMIMSWTFILTMLIFCFSRIFRKGLGGENSKILNRLKK